MTDDIPGWAWLFGGAVLVYLLYRNRTLFDPTSDQNLAYQAANSATKALTGGKETDFGGWLYSVTHQGEFDVTTYSTQDGQAVPTQVTRRSDGQTFSVDSAGFVNPGDGSLYHVASDGTVSKWL